MYNIYKTRTVDINVLDHCIRVIMMDGDLYFFSAMDQHKHFSTSP